MNTRPVTCCVLETEFGTGDSSKDPTNAFAVVGRLLLTASSPAISPAHVVSLSRGFSDEGLISVSAIFAATRLRFAQGSYKR